MDKTLFYFCLVFISCVLADNSEWNTHTKEEKSALKKFRPMVKSIVYEEYMLTDDYLIPWLRARKLNLDRAKTMLENNLKWRKENDIDNIHLSKEDFSKAEQCMKIHHGGQDRRGRPIVYSPMGSWDIRKCALAGHLPQMHRFIIKHYLEGPARVARTYKDPVTGGNVTQFTSIMDMRGFNLRKGGCLACLPLFGTWAYYVETYFPAEAYKYYFINTPQSFQVVLDFVKPILTPPTSNALHLYGHSKDEWSKAIDKDISIDQMPHLYGGKRKETAADRALY